MYHSMRLDYLMGQTLSRLMTTKCIGYYAPYSRNTIAILPFRSAVHEDDRLPAHFDRFPGPGQPETRRPRLRAAEAVRHRPLHRSASLVPEGPRPEAYRGVARHAGCGGPLGRQRVVPLGPQPEPGDSDRRRV